VCAEINALSFRTFYRQLLNIYSYNICVDIRTLGGHTYDVWMYIECTSYIVVL